MMQFFKKSKLVYPGIYLLIVTFIIAAFLIKQIGTSYQDFSEGNYLYLSSIFFKGVPYKDFLVPHPPVLFIIGAVLTKIAGSIYHIRAFNLVIYLAGALLFYRLSKKVIKNDWLALLAGVLYFILPLSSIWFMTFTMEVYLKLMVLIALNILIPLEKLNGKKTIAVALISVVMVYIKYSAVPVVGAIALSLYIFRKDLFYKYTFIVASIGLGVFLFLQAITNGLFLEQTFFIRSIIPKKAEVDRYISSLYALIEFIPFIFVNVLVGYRSWVEKNSSVFTASAISVFYFLVFFITLNVGTYNYIYYPVEPVLLLSLFYFLNKKRDMKKPFYTIPTIVGVFFCGLVLVYSLQIFPYKIEYIRNPIDSNSTRKVVEIIRKNSSPGDRIIAPPFFAVASNRRIARDFSDIFMWSIIANYGKGKEWQQKAVEQIAKDVSEGKPAVILVDQHVKSMSAIMNRIDVKYKKIGTFEFVINRGDIEVYVRN